MIINWNVRDAKTGNQPNTRTFTNFPSLFQGGAAGWEVRVTRRGGFMCLIDIWKYAPFPSFEGKTGIKKKGLPFIWTALFI
ncbi:hypothetical protein DMA11_14235 [Marinilabiliaceae bacterium JC017]|nr:hypothetical protein DMA11_14235 [Marinilabiliaceae bacterium JC017]